MKLFSAPSLAFLKQKLQETHRTDKFMNSIDCIDTEFGKNNGNILEFFKELVLVPVDVSFSSFQVELLKIVYVYNI